jgi:SWI/SNF-related matrix-associated actin-dependent regulator of chromatin subfamily A3
LKDPGLVYLYHGQSRKREAALLAKNSIVVTTYQVLASNATYYAKKAGDDYCAPCEQVRWWRIICDKSHSLRKANPKKSAAVMNLVADHKWLLSGMHPLNDSFFFLL